MTSIFIVERQTVPGKTNRPVRTRYHVRMQHNSTSPSVHLGVFRTKKLAQQKIDGAFALLAQGVEPTKNPTSQGPALRPTVSQVADAWLASRIDVAENTTSHFSISVGHIKERFGTMDPHAIEPDDVRDWISEQLAHKPKPYAAATIRLRLTTLGSVLDYARVEPNPVRDRLVKKPKKPRKIPRMPNLREREAIYRELAASPVGRRSLECVRLIEHTGMRVSEACAVEYEHWNRRKQQLLVPEAKTEDGTRWIQQIDGFPPMPEPGRGRMFPGLTHEIVRRDMLAACRKAGIRRFSPKDLRDLSASTLLHTGKLSPAEIAARMGHRTPEITLRVYAHTLPPEDDEVYSHVLPPED